MERCAPFALFGELHHLLYGQVLVLWYVDIFSLLCWNPPSLTTHQVPEMPDGGLRVFWQIGSAFCCEEVVDLMQEWLR